MSFEQTYKSPASGAIAELMEAIADDLEKERAGINIDADTEYLHKFRIAVRKMRSLLALAKGVIPRDARRILKNEYAWLGQLSSSARDCDVQIQYITEQMDEHPELHIVVEDLEKIRQETYATLVDGLASSRYANLLDTTRRTASIASGYTDSMSVGSFVEVRVPPLVDDILNQVRKLKKAPTPESRHELRKSNKKLRYFLEFFAPSLKQTTQRKLLKTVKLLHSRLGTLQDLSVQRSWLAERLASCKAQSDSINLAFHLGVLSGRSTEAESKELASFDREVAHYESDLEKLSSKLFRSATKKK